MHHIKIATTIGFDGTTVADLSTPVYNAPLDRYEFSFTTAVGLFPLDQMPDGIGGGNVDLFFQLMDVIVAGVGGTISLRPPNGSLIPIHTNGAAPPLGDATRWNIVKPQGWSLAADDQSGGPGVIDLYLYEYGSSDWYLFQCCHVFTPIPMDIFRA